MDTKQCPYCGEEILTTAQKCKHCGEWLAEKQENELTEKNRKQGKKPKIAIVVGAIALAAIIALVWMITPTSKLYIGEDNLQEQEYIGEVNLQEQEYIGEDARLKREIVGKYSYYETVDDDEVYVTGNGIDTYNANGTCETNEVMTMHIFDEDGDKIAIVKLRLKAQGKYKIENSYISTDYRLENIEITFIESEYDPEFYNFDRKWFNESLAPRLKHILAASNSEDEIIELNDKCLKTRDSDGEITAYVRMQ